MLQSLLHQFVDHMIEHFCNIKSKSPNIVLVTMVQNELTNAFFCGISILVNHFHYFVLVRRIPSEPTSDLGRSLHQLLGHFNCQVAPIHTIETAKK